MKIIVCTRDLDFGVGSVVKNELKRYDQDNTIKKITVIGPKRIEGYSSKINFIVIKNKGKLFVTKEPNFAFRCPKIIDNLIETEKYDKIITHFPINAKKFKIKLESKFHGMHLSLIKNHPLSTLFLISIFFHFIYSYFDYKTIKYSNEVSFVSKRTLLQANTIYKKFKSKFKYSPNKVDKKIFFKLSKSKVAKFRKDEHFSNDVKNILFVGRLEPLKGIMELIEVIRELNQEDFSLVVIGDGPLRKKIMKVPFVDYRGKINNDELIKYYNASDAFVLPSYYENCPMTILEADACGCKIISSDVGDVKYLFPKSTYADKNELKEMLENL